ncbi:hybrid sensor histidine kinase/response regulator transcription factor [Flexithrix dorotheae]|uniref:hybrid sensor histidine kinase/response regulator transcription factor n=1 Tax=Flexithrix dorotheae TaxID=70993 RepID=UPI00035F051E|nr:hybrid sensor histidine kinase/response regulator transcription factor [Flexithrix dorotheae]
MPKAILYIVFFICAFSKDGLAQRNYTPASADPFSEPWRFTHFDYFDGKGVHSYLLDENGDNWFGINNGIIKYDGYSYQVFSRKNGLPDGQVSHLLKGKNNQIYVGTSSGIYIKKGNRFLPIIQTKTPYDFAIQSFKELQDGTLAISLTDGLLLFKEEMLIFVSNEDKGNALLENLPISNFVKIPSNILEDGTFTNISDVLEKPDGKLWVALTFDGHGKILEFSKTELANPELESFNLFSDQNGYLLGEDQKMMISSKNEIWIINQSTKKGIYHIKENNWKYFSLHQQFGGDDYNVSITESTDGTIWVGGLSKLFVFDGRKWKRYASPAYNIPASKITVFPTQNERIWITGLQSKIILMDLSERKWESFPGLNFQCESGDGSKWFITTNGSVVKEKEGEWKIFRTDDGLIDAPVSLISTKDGQIWAAGSHQGVAATAFLKNGKWEKQLHSYLSWGIDYRAVFEDKDGGLWFGGSVDRDPQKGHLGGILMLKKPSSGKLDWVFHQYKQNGLQQSNAYGIAQSPDGRIWIGGSYLYSFNHQIWANQEDLSLRQFVNIVFSDTQYNLYVGSRFYGIFIYDGEKWTNYDINDGLESNTIISLAKNSKNYLLAVTENSISAFNGQDWISNIFPPAMNMSNEGGEIKTDKEDNIWINKSTREWKRRAFNNSYDSPEASRNFITYRYQSDTFPPNTVISFFNEEVQSSGNTTISWQAEDFMNYTDKAQLSYSYKLNDGEWSTFQKGKNHVFTGLDPGEYRLQVRARDTDFNVDPTPATINFQVLAPIYLQPWFLITIFAFTVVLIYLSIKIIKKNSSLEALNLSLNEINHELKDKNQQIEEQNTKIIEHQTELEETNQQLENQNHEIAAQKNTLEKMVKEIDVLSKTKIKFFTNITHEFRTPLTLIQGPTERLIHERLPETEKTNLYEIINRNTFRLKQLINQLLDFRKMEKGIIDLNLQKGDVISFIKMLKKQFNNLAYQKEIRFKICHEPQYLDIYFDSDKLEKILFNLLSNAFKFTPNGGEIWIKIFQKTEEEKEFVAIEVIDSGKGIEKAQLDLIFRRYYQTFDAKKFNQNEGSGIGLSYIKELVEFLHGKIEVKSAPGKGTTFSILLPTFLEPEETKEVLSWNENYYEHSESKPEPELSIQSNHNILLVEDNKDMRLYLKGILSQHYQYYEASEGNEAIEVCKNHDIDLIVSDVMMPGMDGLSFCDHIKTNFETSHIPVILLTARVMEENEIEGYEHGADAYITKPFNTKLLIVRIEKLLEQRLKLKEKFNKNFSIDPREVSVISEDEKFLNRLAELMEEHIEDPAFDINKLCELLNKTHIQFIRKTKQLTGKKPVELLRAFRIKRAKQLLEQDKFTISEIAYMVGYDLPNSFTRAFKKEEGISPTEYFKAQS